jgi:transposase
VRGERIGVDGSAMEANAVLRTIVRRDNGESYREMLTRMAKESGIDTSSAEDLVRFDRKRKGHRQLNELGGEGRVSAGHVDSP